jgi:predicted nucleic acid-binding protein
MTRSTKRSVTELFVDTSAFFALANLADRHHAEAVDAFAARIENDDFKTSDHVVVETWCLLRSRLGRRAAMAFWDGFDDDLVTISNVEAADLRRAREIAQQWSDQTFSIVDCTSFALIERLDIRRAFAFDQHFRTVRFGRRRQRALEIIPY